jgi:transposase
MRPLDVLPVDWREWRRFQSLELKRHGWFQRDIAEALGVCEVTISRWLARARTTGTEALFAHPSPGHPSELSPAERRLIPEFLWHGPEAYGFRGEVWTCARVAKVIEWEFGVTYHKGHVARLLRELGWSPQAPIRRAIQRDEEAIERWRNEIWPELRKRARRERRVLVFVDEAGFYLLPGVVKTYAPVIRTYVVPQDNIWSGSAFRNICPTAIFNVRGGGQTYVWKVGADAGPPSEADSRPPLGHGRDDADGQDLHLGAAGVA